jgi:UPF0755 protein
MRPVWIIASLSLLALPLLAYGTFEWLLLPTSSAAKRELVVIKPGTGVAMIAHQLHESHLIRNELAFKGWLRVKGYDHAIKAGAYAISPEMGSKAIAEVLAEGKGLNTRLTVPEGFSLRQIAAALDKRDKGSGARFLVLARHAAYFRPEFPWLGQLPDTASLEGFLFPDTYVVTPGPDAERDLIRMMLGRFGQVAIPTFKTKKANSGLTLLQAVTMASIVEKEAVRPVERPIIAGVFYNRMATHMPFGSDPTVEYALQRHQDARGLTFKDVKIDSPYNTYVHPGLPPGPIANPSLASLQAALSPANTQFLYFVAKGDGSHQFTRSYAEHLAAQRAIVAAQRH